VGEIIASGWDLYCLHLKRILLIFLVVYVPINIGLSFVPAADWAKTYGTLGHNMHMAIIQLSELFVGVLATMALAKLIEESLYGHTITWLQALRHAVSRWGAAIGTGLLALLIVFGLMLLLIVPGVIWMIYYSFFIFAVALRGLSGKPALDYSKALVQGQWWRVFGYLLVIQALGVLAAMVVTAPFQVLPEHRLLGILANTLADLVAPLFLTMAIVFFLNSDYLRTWKEPANPPTEDAADIPPAPQS
jgi:hypothetical protein